MTVSPRFVLVPVLLSLLGALALPACAGKHSVRFTGTLPSSTTLDLDGTFALSATGELVLSLANPCMTTSTLGTAMREHPCDRAHLDAIAIVADTPWRERVRGTWRGPSQVAFLPDWKHTTLDLLSNDAPAVAARPWAISGTAWTPSADDARRILRVAAEASDTEPDLVRGGQAPSLEVAPVEIDGGGLRAGGKSTLRVKITNRGPGIAYRVAATTRSSVEALHGRRLAFGMIKPGAEKVRSLVVDIPSSETSPDTMLVVELAEGNGHAPANVNRRLPIAKSTNGPTLGVQCAIAGRDTPRPELEVGDSPVVRCVVRNTGDGAATVELDAALPGASPARARAAQPVPAGGQATFDVAVAIPRELPADSNAEITITARDRQAQRTATTTLVGVVRRARLCRPGQLSRAQYKAKLGELRAAVTAGDLTQAQLDRYDAELVTCLK